VNLPANSLDISTIYPNSFPNMAQRVVTGVGYENRSVLPGWMTSRQTDGKILGFTRALVLCYTNPGRSAEIAYRVKQVQDTFSLIDFTIDRYEWDSVLSENFVKAPAAGTGNITANTQSATVIGAGTDFTHQLYPGKSIYVANVLIGNVKTVSNSTVLTLTANSVSNVTSSNFTFSTNAFATSNFIDATGNITANTASNLVIGTNTTVVYSGTISGTASNATIIGTGTNFSTNLRIGDQLYYSGNLTSIGTIASIISSTKLVLGDPLTSTITSATYASDGDNTRFLTELRVGDTIVVANTIIGTVQTLNGNANLTLTSNAYANVTSLAYQHTSRDPYTTPGEGDKYLKFPQVGVLA
jgi:cytoskeletal protein CcmA (bactofilin family)